MAQEFCVTQESASQETETAALDTHPVMLTPSQESASRAAEMTASLRRLAQLVAENGLSEVTIADAGVTLTVKAAFEAALVGPSYLTSVQAHPYVLPPDQAPAYSEAAVTTPAAPAYPGGQEAPARAAAVTAIALESPMVGVFYRSPSPEDPPFVSVGDLVRVGQPIGLIEAMKVYSEVPSEVTGRVTDTPIESGKLVQQGQPLIFVEPQ